MERFPTDERNHDKRDSGRRRDEREVPGPVIQIGNERQKRHRGGDESPRREQPEASQLLKRGEPGDQRECGQHGRAEADPDGRPRDRQQHELQGNDGEHEQRDHGGGAVVDGQRAGKAPREPPRDQVHAERGEAHREVPHHGGPRRIHGVRERCGGQRDTHQRGPEPRAQPHERSECQQGCCGHEHPDAAEQPLAHAAGRSLRERPHVEAEEHRAEGADRLGGEGEATPGEQPRPADEHRADASNDG